MQALLKSSGIGITVTASPAGEKELHFQQGEILKGSVQGIRPDGTISLLINDKLVTAVSEEPLVPGQQLNLLVNSFRNGVTHLKIILEQETARPAVAGQLDDARGVGEPSQADTLLIVRALLQRNLSATPQNVADIISAVNMIGGITARNIETAVFALEHNIPLDKKIFPSFNQFISADSDLSRLVRELMQILIRIESVNRPDSFASKTTVASAPSSPAPASAWPTAAAPAVIITSGSFNPANASPVNAAIPVTAGLAVVSDTATAAAEINDNPASGNIANIIQQSANRQGVAVPLAVAAQATGAPVADSGAAAPSSAAAAGLETPSGGSASANNLLSAHTPNPPTTVETGTIAPNVSGSVPNSAIFTTLIAANQIPAGVNTNQTPVDIAATPVNLASQGASPPGDLTELFNVLRTVLDSAVGKIAGSGSHVNPVLQEMVRDRTLLLDNLRGLIEMFRTDEMLGKSPAGQELLTKISNLLQQFTGQAVFNNAAHSSQNFLLNDYYFSFPVEIDNQLTYCQLRIQKNTNNQLDEQDNIKLVVSLDTPSLGIVMFHIDWHRQGYIQLRGVAETDAAGGFIGNNIGELINKLGELGYKVNDLGIKVSKKPEELNLKPLIKKSEQDKIVSSNIDIMA